jgi:hypothetical protein
MGQWRGVREAGSVVNRKNFLNPPGADYPESSSTRGFPCEVYSPHKRAFVFGLFYCKRINFRLLDSNAIWR